MRLKEHKKINFKLSVMALVALIVIVLVMVEYAVLQHRQVISQTEYSMSKDTKTAAGMIDYTIADALNSIQVTSTAITNTMTDSTLKTPGLVLNQLIGNTPFASMEYITVEGFNVTQAGFTVDDSNQEYYIKGIKGKTGIYVNYTPRYASEPLLTFYTPLYFEGRIVGVIIGTIGGNSTIQPLLISEYYNQKVSGMLLDENDKIIASTEQFPAGMELNRNTAAVYESYKDVFFDAIARADGEPFNVGGREGNSIGVAYRINDTGWKVVHIFPSTSLKKVMSNTTNAAYWSIGIVLLASLALFVTILLENNKVSKSNIRKANSERDEQLAVMLSMSDIYYSMHLISLKDNTLVEYSSHDVVKEIVSHNTAADKIMREIMASTIVKEHIKHAFDFTDLSNLAERMKGKKFISTDLIGKTVGWVRISFIAIETDADGVPYKVLCTSQVVDEEKRREEQLVLQSNTDGFTGFYNRRAYENDMAEYRNSKLQKDWTYVSLDINGLKTTNDTYGHDAGDELIDGAARCMRFSFGNYGKIYRIGGDEFVAIILAKSEVLEDIKADFAYNMANWSGELIASLAVSAGYVSAGEHPELNVDELAKLADERMYENKTAYYNHKGVDRRGQAAAHTALCARYTKILKINITEDNYQIVNMDDSERTPEAGYSDKISAWISNFGKCGKVHPEDLQSYLAKTDISFMRDYFKQGKTSLSIMYRRDFDGEWRNVVMEIIPAKDYTDDNQNLYLYVKPIEI